MVKQQISNLRSSVRFWYPAPKLVENAPMAKLVDAPDLGSGIERCVGSSPTWGTKVFVSLV
jgi:hypothetical protein